MRSLFNIFSLLLISFFVFVTFSLPVKVLAAEKAGFASATIWFSKDNFYADDTVKVYTTIYNSSLQKIFGNVDFLDNDSVVGSVSFSIDGGDSQVISINWKAIPGQHNFRAEITGANAALSDGKTGTVTLLNQSAPQTSLTVDLAPVALLATSIDPSDTRALGDVLSQHVPSIAPIMNPVIKAADSVRNTGVSYLGNKINEANVATWNERLKTVTHPLANEYVKGSANVPPKEKILKSAPTNFLTKMFSGSNLAFVGSVSLGIKYFLYYIFKYAVVFYVVSVFILFYLIRFIFRRFSVEKI